MRKTNIYIVTYNNPERLNENLFRLTETTKHIDLSQHSLNVVVINNHTNFFLDDRYKNITVWHNVTRPNFSCGHLSRDYNAALIHGFQNLKTPAVNQIVCAHDDSMWHKNWFEDLLEIHNTYSFYVGDYGCSMHSYLPEAVKTIGIWDERFCNIGYHEADYLLRALIYNKDKSTINDYMGGRVLNPTKVLFDHPPANHNKLDHSNASLRYHTVTRKVFEEKWGVHPEFWDKRMLRVPTEPKINQFMFYPYFELDISDLDNKKYIYALAGLEHFKEEWK